MLGICFQLSCFALPFRLYSLQVWILLDSTNYGSGKKFHALRKLATIFQVLAILLTQRWSHTRTYRNPWCWRLHTKSYWSRFGTCLVLWRTGRPAEGPDLVPWWSKIFAARRWDSLQSLPPAFAATDLLAFKNGFWFERVISYAVLWKTPTLFEVLSSNPNSKSCLDICLSLLKFIRFVVCLHFCLWLLYDCSQCSNDDSPAQCWSCSL